MSGHRRCRTVEGGKKKNRSDNLGFRNLEDVARCAKLERGALERLTEGGAFTTLAGHPYQTHREVQGMLPPSPLPDKVAEPAATWQPDDPVLLPAPTETNDLRADYSSPGLTLGRQIFR